MGLCAYMQEASHDRSNNPHLSAFLQTGDLSRRVVGLSPLGSLSKLLCRPDVPSALSV